MSTHGLRDLLSDLAHHANNLAQEAQRYSVMETMTTPDTRHIHNCVLVPQREAVAWHIERLTAAIAAYEQHSTKE